MNDTAMNEERLLIIAKILLDDYNKNHAGGVIEDFIPLASLIIEADPYTTLLSDKTTIENLHIEIKHLRKSINEAIISVHEFPKVKGRWQTVLMDALIFINKSTNKDKNRKKD